MDIHKLPVHPLADVFPMLSKWELQELADDIKANGQNHPIVIGKVDGKLMLIDGRNRRAACLLAKVEPITKELGGADAVALIVSENLMRRNLTVSQRAMLMTARNPKGTQGKTSLTNKRSDADPSKSMLERSRFIRANASDLVTVVVTGSMTVSEAFRKAQSRALENKKEETLYDDLASNAPDLAERVDAGEKIEEVWPDYKERLKEEKANRVAQINQMVAAVQWFGNISTVTNRESVLSNLKSDEAIALFDGRTVGQFISELKKGVIAVDKLVKEISDAKIK